MGIRVVRRYDLPPESSKRVRPRPAGVLLLVMTPVLIGYAAVSGWMAAKRAHASDGVAPLTYLANISNAGWGMVSVLVGLGCVTLGILLITRGLSRGAAATLGTAYAVAGLAIGLLSLILVFALFLLAPSAGVGWVVAAFGLMVSFACTVFGWNLAVTNRVLCFLLSSPAGVGRSVWLGPGWRTVILVGPETTERAQVVVSSAEAVPKAMVRIDRLTRSPFGPRNVVVRATDAAWRSTVTGLAWGSPVVVVDVSTPTERLLEDLQGLGGWRGGSGRNSVVVCTQQTADTLVATAAGDANPTARLAGLLDGRDVLAYDEQPQRRREFSQSLRNRVEAVLGAPARVATVTATPSPVDGRSAPDPDDGT